MANCSSADIRCDVEYILTLFVMTIALTICCLFLISTIRAFYFPSPSSPAKLPRPYFQMLAILSYLLGTVAIVLDCIHVIRAWQESNALRSKHYIAWRIYTNLFAFNAYLATDMVILGRLYFSFRDSVHHLSTFGICLLICLFGGVLVCDSIYILDLVVDSVRDYPLLEREHVLLSIAILELCLSVSMSLAFIRKLHQVISMSDDDQKALVERNEDDRIALNQRQRKLLNVTVRNAIITAIAALYFALRFAWRQIAVRLDPNGHIELIWMISYASRTYVFVCNGIAVYFGFAFASSLYMRLFAHALRCGHDDVVYDIFRNDHIEPARPIASSTSHTHHQHKLSNPFLTSGSMPSAIGAESWLLEQLDDRDLRRQLQSSSNANIAQQHDEIQTFSSRKNTKPHRHHMSPHAFEHNEHHRHHPKLISDSHDLLFVDEDENDHIDTSVWKPFRIHFNTDSLMSAWSNTEEATHFAENVIPAAMHYLERSLFVRPVQGKLKLSRPCVKFIVDEATGKKKCVQLKWNYEQCGSHVTIPTTDFEDTEICELDEENKGEVKNCKTMKGGAGHDADINIYFSGENDYGCGDVYGYSAYCHSNKFDRPLAGFVNLCEATLIQKNRIFTWEQKVTLVVHEVFHVLGFSSTGFAYFRYNNEQRTARTPRDKLDGHPLKNTKSNSGDGYMYGSNTIQYHQVRDKFATFIVLPTVIKYAKKFFQCSSVIGIELEDFGGHDTAASHWEQRILGYEFMIGYIPPAAPFSIFSFAVLEDSGWYKVNWKYASQHPYGRQFGCDWIDKKCLSDDAKDMLDPLTFCTSDIDYGCSKDHIAISNCQIEEYKFNLPQYFQYFSEHDTGNKNLGGRLEYADYCPMYYHYNNGDCRFIDASIKHKRFGATITPQSKCVIISHPEYHYLNLKMQGLDGKAIVNGKEMKQIPSAAADAASASDFGEHGVFGHHGRRHHHRRKKPLPKELGVCYKQECFSNAANKWSGLRIEIWNMEYSESEWITCWKDEDDAKYKLTSLHEYDIRCPVLDDICYDKNPWLCNGHGMYDKYTHTCVCNAGYIGCDCLYDDTAQNREKYPYSDHKKCAQYNVVKQGIFDKPPVGGGDDDSNEDEHDRLASNGLDILHDIIWNEIDVHFGKYEMMLFNLEMDLSSPKKYVTKKALKAKNEQLNLDFIQIAKTIKLLVAIPLKIDIDKVWITRYRIIPHKKQQQKQKKSVYDLKVSITFENQDKMSNQKLSTEMNEILHKLFPAKEVRMETLHSNEGGDEGATYREYVDDAKLDLEDYDQDERDLGITFPALSKHHSAASRHEMLIVRCVVVWFVLYKIANLCF